MPSRNKGARSASELREHYEVEKELANKLRKASKSERAELYTSIYDELFRRVPHHTLLARKASPDIRKQEVLKQMNFLKIYLDDKKVFMEVGAGDCALSFHVAKYVKKVYALDVSRKITAALSVPDNFSLLISDGTSIPVPDKSIDIVYSNQLMEHLHPDDALDQLTNIIAALKPGGIYICITPNRMNGPHDISKYFDDVATGLHLKEYTCFELNRMFKNAGFSKVLILNSIMGRYIRTPVLLPIIIEMMLGIMPKRLRNAMASKNIIRRLIKVRLVGKKM